MFLFSKNPDKENSYNIQMIGVIGESSKTGGDDGVLYEELNTSLTDLEKKGLSNAELNVYISSPGGYVKEGHNIYKRLYEWSGLVNTTIVRGAYSIATIIALAGKNRSMVDTAKFMIHSSSLPVKEGVHIDYNEAKELLTALKTVNSEISEIYGRHSNALESDDFFDILSQRHDSYYTLSRAKRELGFDFTPVKFKEVKSQLKGGFQARLRDLPLEDYSQSVNWLFYENAAEMKAKPNKYLDLLKNSAEPPKNPAPEQEAPSAQDQTKGNTTESGVLNKAAKLKELKNAYNELVAVYSEDLTEEESTGLIKMAMAGGLSEDNFDAEIKKVLKSKLKNQALSTNDNMPAENEKIQEQKEVQGLDSQALKAHLVAKIAEHLPTKEAKFAVSNLKAQTKADEVVKEKLPLSELVFENLVNKEVIKNKDSGNLSMLSTSDLPDVIGDLFSTLLPDLVAGYDESSHSVLNTARTVPLTKFGEQKINVPVVAVPYFEEVAEGAETPFIDATFKPFTVYPKSFKLGTRITPEAFQNDNIGLWTFQVDQLAKGVGATKLKVFTEALTGYAGTVAIDDKKTWLEALSEARHSFRNLKDKNGNPTPIQPRYLVVDARLQETLSRILNAKTLPGTFSDINPVADLGWEVHYVNFPDNADYQAYIYHDDAIFYTPVVAQLNQTPVRLTPEGVLEFRERVDFNYQVVPTAHIVKIKTSTITGLVKEDDLKSTK